MIFCLKDAVYGGFEAGVLLMQSAVAAQIAQQPEAFDVVKAHGLVFFRCHPEPLATVLEKALHLCLRLYGQTLCTLEVGRKLVNAIISAQQPEVALSVGTCKGGLAQRKIQLTGARLSIVALIGQVSVGTERPSGAKGVFPRNGFVFLEGHAGAIAVHVVLGTLLGQIAEPVGVCIEQEIIIVYTTDKVAVGSLDKHPDAVCRHVAAVTCLWLECSELVAIVSAQSVPRREPHQPLPVLQQLGNVTMRQPIVIVVISDMTKWLGLSGQPHRTSKD